MSVDFKTKDFLKMTIEDATTPKESRVVMLNRWWAVKDGCIWFYKGYSPQCNPDERITALLPLCKKYGAIPTFIPLVFIEHNCSDYYRL